MKQETIHDIGMLEWFMDTHLDAKNKGRVMEAVFYMDFAKTAARIAEALVEIEKTAVHFADHASLERVH